MAAQALSLSQIQRKMPGLRLASKLYGACNARDGQSGNPVDDLQQKFSTGRFYLNPPLRPFLQSPRRGRLWPLCVRSARQAHCKYRTFARLAPHRHIATHHARELAGDGKAETRAAVALRG